MTLHGKQLAVSIPDTVLEEKESPREKTAKLGIIARACAIYGVDVVEIFKDLRGKGEREEIAKVLGYLETPQYLRKRLYPIDESLRYAGALPPLRTPSHKPRVPAGKLERGEVREGVMNPDGTVDIGLDVRPKLTGNVPSGKRVTVRVTSLNPVTAEQISKEKTGTYWGYDVEVKSVLEVFSDARFPVKVATSRLGDTLTDKMEALSASIRRQGGVKMIFGSPSRGLFDIVGPDLARKCNFILNLFGEQHVETVRTEEAIFAGLGLVNTLMSGKA
ncbi:MAG TPA: RNA methyltransferase [Nitrososphaerales archaeon]|nr:RNA methyltransferase [Nitrososphaerales archaeon]